MSEIPKYTQEEIKEVEVQDVKGELETLKDETMQKISNKDFLKIVSFENRLKNITDPNVDFSTVSENSEIVFNFSFTSDIQNDDLYFKTTAGQVLPNTVKTLSTSNGKVYSRKSLNGEFFAEDGKRLVIHDNSKITIGELRTQDEVLNIIKKQEDKVSSHSLLNDKNKNLLILGALKGIDSDLLLAAFSAYFSGKSIQNVHEDEYENFFAQVDRHVGYINQDEKIIDKNNMSQGDKDMLVAKIGYKEKLPSTFNMGEFPELHGFAKEYGINNPEFLFAICDIESSFGKNTQERKESGGRFSMGMFQILNTNLTPELTAELKNNPTDRAINIKALKYFLDNNMSLVTAINNDNFHEVASIYNGRYYKQFAETRGYVSYDEKLKVRVDFLRNQK